MVLAYILQSCVASGALLQSTLCFGSMSGSYIGCVSPFSCNEHQGRTKSTSAGGALRSLLVFSKLLIDSVRRGIVQYGHNVAGSVAHYINVDESACQWFRSNIY